MDISTEEKIYEAARRIFILKGMDGTRMQEIADEAGMNKALLHYYFRSKDNLFKAVFKDIVTKFFKKVSFSISSDMPLKEKLCIFIDNYIDLISANPYVPQFIFTEINRDPMVLKSMFLEAGVDSQKILELIFNEVMTHRETAIDPRHLVVSLLGMMVFPFIGRPLLQAVFFKDDQESYNRFLDERKEVIKNMIIKYIEA